MNKNPILYEWTHKQLINVAYKWVLKNASCGIAFKELVAGVSNGECPDVIGFGQGHSVLIEVKISRSDFHSDKKKLFRMTPELGMGNKRYYCVPKGLIHEHELPTGWGLIWVNTDGKATCIYDPYKRKITNGVVISGIAVFNANIRAEKGIMYSALRRLHIKGFIDSIYDKQYNYNHKD